MKLTQLILFAAITVPGASLAGATQAGGMYIESCNLVCNSGAGGVPVSGQTVSVFENHELRVTFSLAVDPSSLSYFSFPIVNIWNGTIPAGSYTIDPWDPRTVVFTPELTFDANTTPHYGFGSNQTYLIKVPGTSQGGGSQFITSTTGLLNQSPLSHTIQTDLGFGPTFADTCHTSPNSVGAGANLSLAGSNSIFLDSLAMMASSAPAMTMGVFVTGREPSFHPLGQGTLCLGGMTQRLATGATDVVGSAQHAVDVSALGVVPGDTQHFQFWYRDSGTSNLSNGVRVQFYH